MRRGSRASRIRRYLLSFLILLAAAAPAGSAAAAPLQQRPREIEAGAAHVVHWPGHEALARRMAGVLEQPLRFPGLPDAQPPAGTRVYLAPNAAVFDSLTGGRAPDWSAGIAIPARQLAIIPVYPVRAGFERDPFVTLRHEIAHLVVHHELPGPVPRWFDEGYATWVSGGWDQSSAWQIRLAFLLRRAPPLDSLTLDWPRGAEQARLAYLLSASAVRYLAEIGGERGFEVLLTAWREDGSLDVALRRVYGMTPGYFEREWGQMVQRRYGWLLAISQISLFWTFAGLLLIVLFWIRRRRKRERLAQLELEDRLAAEAEDAETHADADVQVVRATGSGADAALDAQADPARMEADPGAAADRPAEVDAPGAGDPPGVDVTRPRD